MEEPTLFSALKNEEIEDENIWYLNNEVSNHVWLKKKTFVELEEMLRGNVLFEHHSNFFEREYP